MRSAEDARVQGAEGPSAALKLVHVTTTDMSLALLLGPQLRAFAEAGYEVIGASAPGPHAGELAALGVRHVPLAHATRAMRPHRDLAAVAELRSLFRSLRPDVVHTHNPKPGLYGRLASRLARVPVVVNTVHGLYAQPGDGVLRRSAVYGLERLAARWSHAELVQSREDLETLAGLGIDRAKLHLLGNGVDLARFDPGAVAPGTRERIRAEIGIEGGTVLAGVVGRLVWEKGLSEVFAAAAGLAGLDPPVRFVVVGPPDEGKTDAVGADALRGAEQDAEVVFLGHRSDMPEMYAAMDVLVLASYREGFPRSAMEASAMGVPVVATDIRGCREAVDDGVTGLLVPPRDATALAEALRALAGDAGRRRAMGSAARAKALREFDDRRVIEITLETYRDLLERHAAGARR